MVFCANLYVRVCYLFVLLIRIPLALGEEQSNVLSKTDSIINFNCTDGKYLSEDVCLPKGYKKRYAPEKAVKVLTDFNWANFRDVDDKKMTITFDVLISYRWIDDRILRNFGKGGKTISYEYLSDLWKQPIYIEHLNSYRQRASKS